MGSCAGSRGPGEARPFASAIDHGSRQCAGTFHAFGRAWLVSAAIGPFAARPRGAPRAGRGALGGGGAAGESPLQDFNALFALQYLQAHADAVSVCDGESPRSVFVSSSLSSAPRA